MLSWTETSIPSEGDASSIPVRVEVYVGPGLPGFDMVGVSQGTVRETRERIRAAFLCAGIPWPMKRITVNVPMLNMRRRPRSAFDLPIAVTLAHAARAERAPAFVPPSELGLNGRLRHQPTSLDEWVG